jgi:hypothetical protein
MDIEYFIKRLRDADTYPVPRVTSRMLREAIDIIEIQQRQIEKLKKQLNEN